MVQYMFIGNTLMSSEEKSLPDISSIKNYPHHKEHIGLHRVGKNIYVEEWTYVVKNINGKDKTITKSVVIGKVVDMVFYTMEEYHKHFMRNGKPREVNANKGKVRKYVRHKPLSENKKRPTPKYAEDIPDKSEVEGFPYALEGARIKKSVSYKKDENGNIIKTNRILYVVTTKYFRTDGQNRHIDTIHGRIVDNKFYTVSEYKKLFARDGSLKKQG